MVHAQRILQLSAGGTNQRFFLPDLTQSVMSVGSDGGGVTPTSVADRMSLEVMEKHLEANRDWYDRQWMQIQQAKAKLVSYRRCLLVHQGCDWKVE